MKARIFLVLITGLLTMGSACTKSCKGTNSATNQKTPEAHDKDTIQENTHKDQLMENKAEKDSLIKEFDLKPGDKLFADIKTSKGTIKAELFWEQAPITVKNFTDLALGKREWIHPTTKEKSTKPLYNNTIFHRVIPGFMIQGGDPAGNGMGGPGYRFKDEFHPALKHNKKGILSMANSGPDTNGSQFFITETATPHLDNRHSVFGQVEDTQSLEIISAIAASPRNKSDKPLTDITIETISFHK